MKSGDWRNENKEVEDLKSGDWTQGNVSGKGSKEKQIFDKHWLVPGGWRVKVEEFLK